MYQYNSIMSAVNDFIDEVNAADSEAKLIKPHTIKEAYELLAGYYGKESGAELLAEYESGRPHDVADATKLLLDILNKRNAIANNPFKYYVLNGDEVTANYQTDNGLNYIIAPKDSLMISMEAFVNALDDYYHVVCVYSAIPLSTDNCNVYYKSQSGDISKYETNEGWFGSIVYEGESYYYFVMRWNNPIPDILIEYEYTLYNVENNAIGIAIMGLKYIENGTPIDLRK